MTSFRPYQYQRYCIDKIIDTPRLGLFLDMGLGKSAITLSAVTELMDRFEVGRVLVVAPKTVAQSTWSGEAAKWEQFSDLRVSVILGTAAQRTKALYKPADIYVTSRDNIDWLVSTATAEGKKWPFDMLVLDESTSFKNPKAKRFRAVRKIRHLTPRIVLLTGTPAPNDIEDLWAQIFILDGGERLERSLTAFRTHYCNSISMFGGQFCKYEPKKGAADAVLARISDICVSMKAADYLQLPDISFTDRDVILSDPDMARYRKLEKEAVLAVADKEITAASAAALSNKLLQLSNGAVYDAEGRTHLIHQAKIEALEELIESLNGKPVLVFYSFISDKERLLEHFKGRRISEYKGADTLAKWNSRELDILLAHPASTAYGLNMQAGGNYIVWFGLPWSYEQYVQANARLHRQGQKEKVMVYHLISRGTRDEDVIKALAMKEEGEEYVLESLKARIQKIKEEATE